MRQLLIELFGAGEYLLQFRKLNIRPISSYVGGLLDWNSEPQQAWSSGLKRVARILDDAIAEAEIGTAGVSPSRGAEALSQSRTTVARAHTNRAFVVHGHDEAVRESVARFLEQLDIEAIMLHEQASGGRTVVEKLEHYSDVDFAIALLTPDDIGGVKGLLLSNYSRVRGRTLCLSLGSSLASWGGIMFVRSIRLPSKCPRTTSALCTYASTMPAAGDCSLPRNSELPGLQ